MCIDDAFVSVGLTVMANVHVEVSGAGSLPLPWILETGLRLSNKRFFFNTHGAILRAQEAFCFCF